MLKTILKKENCIEICWKLLEHPQMIKKLKHLSNQAMNALVNAMAMTPKGDERVHPKA